MDINISLERTNENVVNVKLSKKKNSDLVKFIINKNLKCINKEKESLINLYLKFEFKGEGNPDLQLVADYVGALEVELMADMIFRKVDRVLSEKMRG